MKKVLWLSLLCASYLSAVSLSGYGYGNETSAKQNALDDLSNAISVQVQSDYNSFVSQTGGEYQQHVAKLISIKSNLPILGANFSYDSHEQAMVATITSERALGLYRTKLADIKKELTTLMHTIDTTTNSDKKYALYELALSLVQTYEKHEVVALLLGESKDPTMTITQSDLQAKMIDLSKNITSMELGATLLAKAFTQKGIYVYPATTNGSHEITPFAAVLKDQLSAKLATAMNPKEATYWLLGSYNRADNGVFVTYTLTDKSNVPLQSSSIFFPNSALAGLATQPQNLTFDQEIDLGKERLSSDLKVELSFKDFGSHDLLFKANQELTLIAKANKQAYIYIVGHTLHDNEKFSYLVELQEGNGKERFVYSLGAMDANRPVVLPLNFSVSAPFGYESLQLFASTQNPIDTLPRCVDRDGYCVLGNGANPAIVTQGVRAIKPKIPQTQRAEATLSFTTTK